MNETNMEETSFTWTEAQRRKLLDQIAAAAVRGEKPSTYRDRVKQLVDSGMTPTEIDAALAEHVARQQTRSRRARRLRLVLAGLLLSLLACVLISISTLFIGADPKVQTAFQNARISVASAVPNARGTLEAWLQRPIATPTQTPRPATNTPTPEKPTAVPITAVTATLVPSATPVTPTPIPPTPTPEPTAVPYEAAWVFDPKWVEILQDGQPVEHLGIGLPLTLTLKLSQNSAAAPGVKVSLSADTDLVYFPEIVESLVTDDQGALRDVRFFGKRPGPATLTGKIDSGQEISTIVTFVPMVSCQDTSDFKCAITPLRLRAKPDSNSPSLYDAKSNEKFPLLSCDATNGYCLVWVGVKKQALYAVQRRLKVEDIYQPDAETAAASASTGAGAQQITSPTAAPTTMPLATPRPTETSKPSSATPTGVASATPGTTYTAKNPQARDEVVFYLDDKETTPVLQLPDGGNVTLVNDDLKENTFVRVSVSFWVPKTAVVDGKIVASDTPQACWSAANACGQLYQAADKLQPSKLDAPDGDWQKVELLLWLPADNLSPQ